MSGDLDKIVDAPVSPKDQQIEKIEDDLQAEKASRKQERFGWYIGGVIVADMIALREMPWAGDFVILIFEIVLILYLARLCGVEGIYPMIQNAIDSVNRIGTDKKD